jgi:hypothetical protein
VHKPVEYRSIDFQDIGQRSFRLQAEATDESSHDFRLKAKAMTAADGL